MMVPNERQSRIGRVAGFPVSRETIALLDTYSALTLKWTKAINLVGRSTVDTLWERHIIDSAQCMRWLPETTRTLVDIGSGAGFPGVVLAALLACNGSTCSVTLVESDERKTAFLQAVRRMTGLNFRIENKRVEDVDLPPADAISARAFASVDQILSMTTSLRSAQTTYILPKGRNHAAEIGAAEQCWNFSCACHRSVTDQEAAVVVLRGVRHAG